MFDKLCRPAVMCFIFYVTGRLLGCVPYSRTNPVSTLGEGFELLGVKWVPSLSIQQAKVLFCFQSVKTYDVISSHKNVCTSSVYKSHSS